MSEVMTKLLEAYPAYKDVNREALIDAVGRKYPVYLEQPDFKEEFDALQALNKSVQETPAPAVAPIPEPSVPASQAFDRLFSKPTPAAPAAMPETTASPLTEGAAAQADILRTGVSHGTAVLGDTSDKPILSLPKPEIYDSDPDRLKVAKGMATAISSGLESVLTERGLEAIAVAGPMAPLVFGTLGAVGTVKGSIDIANAKTPEERGRAIGETILNAGMAALAAKSGVGPKAAETLAPKTVEAATAVTKEGAPNAEQISSTAPIHGDVLNEGRPQESAGEVPAVERGAGIQESGQGAEVPKVEEAAGPGAVGMGAATPSEFPTAPSPVREAMESAISPLQKVRRTIKRLWETGEVKDAMARTKDAGDNAASLFAKQTVNDIRKPFEREFAKEAGKAEEALTFAREAGMDENILRADRERVAASNVASSKWGRKAIDAMDYALYHMDQLRMAVQRFGEVTDAQLAAEEASGIPTLRRENYVPHVQDVEAPETFLSSAGGAGEGKPFTKVRTFDKLADSIAAGVDPVTINAVDLLEHRLRQGQRLINNRAWNESLKNLVDPTTRRPVGTAPSVVKRADGSTYLQPPSGYKMEFLGGQPLAIQNGYEGIFSALTDPSYFRKSVAGRSFLQATGAGKSISLMLDTFHLGRVAFWESLIKSLGVKTFKAPFPSYKKGVTLLDYTSDQIREMGTRGEIPREWVDSLVEDKRNMEGLVQHGYNLGRISDALFQDVIHHIPGFGKFNKWLFEQFQRGAMNEVGLLETKRLRAARPELTDEQVWTQTAKDLNIRFGNLGRQGIFKSKSAQDLARMIFLAPQWNEGLIRSELGAITQTGKAIGQLARGENVFGGVLMRSVGAMALMQFVANQLINYYTRGKPTWENPEEGFGAKVSAWIPDKIGGGPGFFLHPLGLAAETTHLITSKFEKTGDMAKTLNQYARSRSSVSMRPVLTFITQQDFLGRHLKPGTVWGEMAKSAIPVPIGGSAVTAAAKELITGQPSETFPGQFQKQVMASVGIKTDQAPSPEQRIRDLAKEFNAKKGIEPSAEFYVGDYQALTQALRIGNKNDAQKALDELLKKKTPSQIITHYMSWANHPFTGQRARETQFRQTLTAEQKTQYDAAVAERRRIGSAARELARTAKKP